MAPLAQLLALVACAGAPSSPSANTSSLVLLVDAALVPTDLTNALQKSIKSAVESGGVFSWHEPPPISMDELLLALACKQIDNACLKKICGALKADAVMVVTIKSGKLQITLALGKKKDKPRVVSTPVGDTNATVTAVLTLTKEWLGAAKPAVLSVITQPPGAQVTLNDRVLGVTPLSLETDSLGEQSLRIALSGYDDVKAPITLESGKKAQVEVTLSAVPAPVVHTVETPSVAAPTKPVEPAAASSGGLPGAAKWGLVGVGAVVGVVGVVITLGFGGVASVLVGAYAAIWAAWFSGRAVGIGIAQSVSIPGSVAAFGSAGVSALGLLLVPVGVAVVAVTLIADVVMGMGGASEPSPAPPSAQP